MPEDIAIKPTPPIPRERNDNSDRPDEEIEVSASHDVEEEDDEPPRKANDPYSNLDTAFGSYLADAPQPMTGRRHGGDDDLLF